MRRLLAGLVAVAFALGVGTTTAAAGGFAPASGSPFRVGISPVSLALGDFNGDGNLDVATANAGTDDVSVLLGNGRGAFAAAPDSPFSTGGDNSFSIAVGDLNLDGSLDAVVTNLLSGSLSVMLGDGTGRLALAPGSPGGLGFVQGVVVGDVNSDGTPDPVVADSGGNTVTALLGDQLGGFDAVTSPTGGLFGPQGLALADFDRDGRLDVAVTHIWNGSPGGNGDVRILRGDGQGAFALSSAQNTDGDSMNVATGDFNSDGNADAVVTNFAAGTVPLFLGDGHGGLAPAPGSPYSPPGCCSGRPLGLAVADFNGDRNADVAVSSLSGISGPEVSVFIGDGRGRLALAPGSPIPVGGSYPSWVAAGDVNNDGRPDLLTSNFLSSTVSVLINHKNAEALCNALRNSMGDGPFGQRYGTNPNRANAFGQCVKQSKGF
jgi:hypothetical protein